MKRITGFAWLPALFLALFTELLFPSFSSLSEAADALDNSKGEQVKHRVVVLTEPDDATVEILDYSVPYAPGVYLPDGKYKIKVSHSGYVSRTGIVNVDGEDVSGLVALKEAPTQQELDNLLEDRRQLDEARIQLEQEKRSVELEKKKIADDWRQIQLARQNLAHEKGKTNPAESSSTGANLAPPKDPIGGEPSGLVVFVYTDGLRLRSSSQSKSDVIKTLSLGTRLRVIGQENHKLHVTDPENDTGWVAETLVRDYPVEELVKSSLEKPFPIQEKVGQVAHQETPIPLPSKDSPKNLVLDGHSKTSDVYANIENLRMRSSAHINANVVRELPLNTPLRVLEAKNGWLRAISPDGGNGWVAEFLVTDRLKGRKEKTSSITALAEKGPSRENAAPIGSDQNGTVEKTNSVDSTKKLGSVDGDYIQEALLRDTDRGVTPEDSNASVARKVEKSILANAATSTAVNSDTGSNSDLSKGTGSQVLPQTTSTQAESSVTNASVSIDQPGSGRSHLDKASGHVDSSDINEVYIHGDKVRMRHAGRPDSMVLKELALNTRLRVLDVEDGWLHVIDPENSTGWVAEVLVGNHPKEKQQEISEHSTPSPTEATVHNTEVATGKTPLWFVQTSFYWDLKSANDDVILLKGKGFKALTVKKKLSSGRNGFYVRIGGYDNRSEAMSVLDQFHDQFGKEGMIVKPKN